MTDGAGVLWGQQRSGAPAFPAGPVGGFAQAADFADSVGVNVHFGYTDTPYWNTAKTLADVGDMGVRHIRDVVYGSSFDFRFQFMRKAWTAIRDRNRNLQPGQQPILLTGFTPGWSGNFAGVGHSYTIEQWIKVMSAGQQHYDGDTGAAARGVPGAIPGVGGPIPDGVSSPSPDAPVPWPWAFSDSEVPWEIFGAVEGPNEPGGAVSQHAQLPAWMAELYAAKNQVTSVAFSGLPYVTQDGVKDDGCEVKQLPLIGHVAMDNGLWSGTFNGQPIYGDFTGQGVGRADVGDRHPYHHHEPNHENVTQFLAEPSGYTGLLRSPPDASKALPWFITEMGYISRGMDSANAAHAAHAGYWPIPDDIIAEYTIRLALLYYARGIRRFYYYELHDEHDIAGAAEQNFGLVRHDGTRKPQWYSLRNLLKLVGFEYAPPADRQPISVGVSGFTPGPANQHVSTYPADAGTVYYQTADRLDRLLLQRSATEYLLILWRQYSLWDREPAVRQPLPASQNLTVTLPANTVDVAVATPTAGGTTAPDDGLAYQPLSIQGGSVAVPFTAFTKVVRIRVA